MSPSNDGDVTRLPLQRFPAKDRLDGAMQAYLDWEAGLVAQLANDGVSRFRVAREAV